MKGGASGQGCAALEVYAADLACAAGVRVHVGHDCVCSLDVKKFMFVMCQASSQRFTMEGRIIVRIWI